MKPQLWRHVRASAFAVLTVLLFLQACLDKDNGGPAPNPNPAPGAPLPDNACAPNIIEGYTDKQSYDLTEKVTLFMNANLDVNLCRLNIYDINGNEAFAIPSPLIRQSVSFDEPWAKGFGFKPTVTFSLPPDLESGVYMIEKKIPFVVRSSSPVDLMIVYASNTANAYNTAGGKSLYTNPPNKPTHVSFHRPMPLEAFSEFCLKWFRDLHGFSIGYIVDSDLDDYAIMKRAKILVLVGHNEYWTRAARLNFDRFVDEGGDALVLSGNTMWWQVRYEDDQKTLVCYKDVDDPEGDPLLQTKNWNNLALGYPILYSIGADFPHGGYGVRYPADGGWDGFKIVDPASPLLEGLHLKKGDIISCPTVEWDGAPIQSFDALGYPVIDKDALMFEKAELIAFDIGYRGVKTYGTFIIFQRTRHTGVVINTSSTDWCSGKGMGGPDGDKIKAITLNALNKLKNGERVFSH